MPSSFVAVCEPGPFVKYLENPWVDIVVVGWWKTIKVSGCSLTGVRDRRAKQLLVCDLLSECCLLVHR